MVAVLCIAKDASPDGRPTKEYTAFHILMCDRRWLAAVLFVILRLMLMHYSTKQPNRQSGLGFTVTTTRHSTPQTRAHTDISLQMAHIFRFLLVKCIFVGNECDRLFFLSVCMCEQLTSSTSRLACTKHMKYNTNLDYLQNNEFCGIKIVCAKIEQNDLSFLFVYFFFLVRR